MTLKPAAEWSPGDSITAQVMRRVIIEVQTNALQAAAEVCRDRARLEADQIAAYGCLDCAEYIERLIPTAAPGEITKEDET